ncbi:MAG: hypothetical protein DRP60_14465, partial [Spirochaetes bacterium]
MDKVAFTPILRGAFMEALGGPVILLSEADERSDLPELKIDLKGADSSGGYDSAVRASEADDAEKISKALAALKDGEGS